MPEPMRTRRALAVVDSARLRRPAADTAAGWRSRALCRGLMPLFYSGEPWAARKAKAICAQCPVLDECAADDEADDGIATSLLMYCGVRGGMTGAERATRRRSVA